MPDNISEKIDAAVMARLRAPFGCEFIEGATGPRSNWWRIHDANDDAIASVAGGEEGYARLIVQALNEHFARRSAESPPTQVEYRVMTLEQVRYNDRLDQSFSTEEGLALMQARGWDLITAYRGNDYAGSEGRPTFVFRKTVRP